jgi:hypothetical protein
MTNLKVRLLNYLETFSGERVDLAAKAGQSKRRIQPGQRPQLNSSRRRTWICSSGFFVSNFFCEN